MALHLGLYWEDQIEGSYEANRYAVLQPEADDKDEGMADIVKKLDEERKKEMEKMRKDLPRPPDYMQGGHMRLIIGISGSSGAIYGIRALEMLRDFDEVETHLVANLKFKNCESGFPRGLREATFSPMSRRTALTPW